MKYGDLMKIAKKLKTSREYVSVVKSRMKQGRHLHSDLAKKISKEIMKIENSTTK